MTKTRHNRQTDGPSAAFYIRKQKKAKKHAAEPEPITSPSGMLWDDEGERWITPCPQCGEPRLLCHPNDEGTVLLCDNWRCPLYRQPMDSKRRVKPFLSPLFFQEKADD